MADYPDDDPDKWPLRRRWQGRGRVAQLCDGLGLGDEIIPIPHNGLCDHEID